MTSRNWRNGFVRGCATISLLLCWPLAGQVKAPAVALIDAADAVQWQNWTRESGWQVITASAAQGADIDARVRALAAAVEAAIQNGSVDPARVYIGGRGDAAAAVFYAISRVPDLWAAGAALGGSPKAAIDTNRIFTANFTNVPVLWISGDDGKPLVEKLTAAKTEPGMAAGFGRRQRRGAHPMAGAAQARSVSAAIDCETNSPAFSRCYWIQPAKFDANERNDVLASTRIPGGQRRGARPGRLRLQNRRSRARRAGVFPAGEVQRRPSRRATV